MVSQGVGYRWFDSQHLTPEFAFGFGLSYTSFEYGNIQLKNENPKIGDLIEVTIDLKNTGSRSGEEVVQLYLTANETAPKMKMPIKQLRGFQKVMLDAGERKTITFEVSPEDFYVYNEETASYQVPSGDYTVKIGSSSDNLPLSLDFSLAESAEQPDASLVNIRTMPLFPKQADEVIFMASLINNGTAPIKKGDLIAVSFYVNHEKVATHFSKSLDIPVGGMEFIAAEGINNTNRTASNGVFEISAEVELDGTDELNILNNTCKAQLTVPNGRTIPMDIATRLP